MKVFLIGGSTETRGTPEFEREISVLTTACHALGQEIASRGHELILCSPFKNSADYHTVIGTADGHDPKLKFHYPDIPPVTAQLRNLLSEIPNADVKRMPCLPVGSSEVGANMQYSWLFAQLNMLDASAGVIAIGGKATGAARLLLQLAVSKNQSILPIPFLGGAAADYYGV